MKLSRGPNRLMLSFSYFIFFFMPLLTEPVRLTWAERAAAGHTGDSPSGRKRGGEHARGKGADGGELAWVQGTGGGEDARGEGRGRPRGGREGGTARSGRSRPAGRGGAGGDPPAWSGGAERGSSPW